MAIGDLKMPSKQQLDPRPDQLLHPVPLRFPRLNATTESLIGKKNLRNYERLRRALQKLVTAESVPGMDLYSAVKIMDSDSDS
jgi:hypothetical protein